MTARLAFAAALAATLLMSGCSTKEYFNPQRVSGEVRMSGSMGAEIVDVGRDGALLDSGAVLTRSGAVDAALESGFAFLGESDGWIISADARGRINMHQRSDAMNVQRVDLKRGVAGATRNGDLLAVLFANNEMALYSLPDATLLFKEPGSAPIAVDARVVNPYVLNDLVLFLTLDGKIVIVNAETKTVLRSMIVSSESFFNNVIYFNVVDNVLVAATGTQILSFGDKEARENYNIRDVVFNEEGIWLSTKQGEVIALTPSLQLKAKQKLPFARFLGMIQYGEKVYLLEKEGYVVVMEADLSAYEVYEADFDEEGYVFAGDHAFYVGGDYLNLR